jgi:hypothetical protein
LAGNNGDRKKEQTKMSRGQRPCATEGGKAKRTNNFSQVAGCNGDFGRDPEEDRKAGGVGLGTHLGKVPFGGDPKFYCQHLEEDCQEGGEEDDGEESIVVDGSSLSRCRTRD